MQKQLFETTSRFSNVPVLVVTEGAANSEKMANDPRHIQFRSSLAIEALKGDEASSAFLASSPTDRSRGGWLTYNFEVAEHHTYVADGIRVHNDSGLLGRVGNALDDALDWLFDAQPGSDFDRFSDALTKPFHAVGNYLDEFQRSVRNDVSDFFDGDGSFRGTPTNSLDELFQDRDNDGVLNIFDTNDGVGMNDVQNGGGTQSNGITYTYQVDENGQMTGAIVGERPDGSTELVYPGADGVFSSSYDIATSAAVETVTVAENDGQGDDNGKPLIIDLDGDGIEITADRNVSFDMDGDGFLEQTSWAAADDGFLVIDLNEDGTRGTGDNKIDQTKELILSKWHDNILASDLQGLGTFDEARRGGNGDGVLDAQDSVWTELKIWQDADQDGEADSGELKNLSDLGISQIDLSYDDGTEFLDESNDVSIFGSTLLGTSSLIRDGVVVEGVVGDVSLSYTAQGWRRIETSSGFAIELETGGELQYVELDGTGSAHVNLDDLGLDGVTGDDRANLLDASDLNRAIQVSGGDGNDTISGGEEADILSGDGGSDLINGGAGDDVVFFDALDSVVSGGAGFDVAVALDFDEIDDSGNLVRSALGVSLDWGASDFEVVEGGDGADLITNSVANAGSISISAGAGNDTIVGGEGNDALAGESGNDSIVGGAGDDSLSSGEGDDTLSGGMGSDSYILSSTGNYVVVEAGTETDNSLTISEVEFGQLVFDQLGSFTSMSWTNEDGTTGSAEVTGWDRFSSFKFGGTSFVSLSEDSHGKWIFRGSDSHDDVVSAGGELTKRYYLVGGEGDDTLIANASAANSGWNYMGGNEGSDTYVYYQVAKDVRVTSAGEGAGLGWDTFRFADVAFSDVVFGTDGDWQTIDWSVNGKSGEVQLANGGAQINVYDFADGTRFTSVEEDSHGKWIFRGSDSHDDVVSAGGELTKRYYLVGGEGDDTLIANASVAGGGWNYMGGNAGNDIYVYYEKAGDVRVTNGGETANLGWDTFLFADVELDEIDFSFVGGKLVAQYQNNSGTDHSIEFSSNGAGIEAFAFENDETTFKVVDQNGTVTLEEWVF